MSNSILDIVKKEKQTAKAREKEIQARIKLHNKAESEILQAINKAIQKSLNELKLIGYKIKQDKSNKNIYSKYHVLDKKNKLIISLSIYIAYRCWGGHEEGAESGTDYYPVIEVWLKNLLNEDEDENKEQITPIGLSWNHDNYHLNKIVEDMEGQFNFIIGKYIAKLH